MAALSVTLLTQKNNLRNDLMLANIEALANNESGWDFDSGTCGWAGFNINGDPIKVCNIAKHHVDNLYSNYGGQWCCDSCSSTWYCG